MSDPRTISFAIDPATWPAAPPAALTAAVAQGQIHLDLDDVLLGIGIRTRPPTVHGFALSDCWAWLRYFPAFQPGPGVRLRLAWSDIDPHHKTVASDDFGIGFGTHILADLLGFEHYSDALWVVKYLEPDRWKLRGSKKRGPKKSPDYVAYDAHNQVSVLECKGGQTTRGGLEVSMERGIAQKRNLMTLAGQQIIHELVVGTFIPQDGAAEDAWVKVIDPSKDDAREGLTRHTAPAIRAAVRSVELATEYAMFNLAETAATLVDVQSEVPVEDALKRDVARTASDGVPVARVLEEVHWAEPVLRGGDEFRGVRYTSQLPPQALDPAWLALESEQRMSQNADGGSVWSSQPTDIGVRRTSPIGAIHTVEWLE